MSHVFRRFRIKKIINTRASLYKGRLNLSFLVFIDRFRYNANRAAQVQSKIKGLEKLPPLVAPEPPEDVNFSFSDKSFDKLDGNFVQIDSVSFRYSAETRWIFKVSFFFLDQKLNIYSEYGSVS